MKFSDQVEGTLISLACFGFLLFADRKQKWVIIIGILVSVTLLSVITLIILILRSSKADETRKDDPNAFSKRSIANRTASLRNFHKEYMEGNLKIKF